MARGDDIKPLTLFDMYDWVCCLCEEKIDKARRLPDLYAATIDHLIPLCQGGTHTWDNVRPAHAACNFKKAGHLTQGY